MRCPACSWLIEKSCEERRSAGGKCPFLSRTWPRSSITPTWSSQGNPDKNFRPGVPRLLVSEGRNGERKRTLLLRLGISSILTGNIMMVAFALTYGFFEDLTAPGIRLLSWPLWAMATPVVFYGGWPILRKGLSALRYRVATMETLISVGALSAYGYSFFQMLRGSLHLIL